jgi:hypothetical protein
MPAWGNYDPSSFGWTPNADIVQYSWGGVTFYNGVTRRVKLLFDALLTELVASGTVPSPFVQSDGYWGYEFREITGGGGTSFHGYGLALDVNAVHNGYSAAGVLDTNFDAAKAGSIARKYLCEWGGGWTSPKDPMHFEVHGTPAEVDALVASLGPGTTDLEGWMATNEDAVRAIVTGVVNDKVMPVVNTTNARVGKLVHAMARGTQAGVAVDDESMPTPPYSTPNQLAKARDEIAAVRKDVNDLQKAVAGLAAPTVDASGIAGAVQALLQPVVEKAATDTQQGTAKMLDALLATLENDLLAGKVTDAPDVGAALVDAGTKITALGKRFQ